MIDGKSVALGEANILGDAFKLLQSKNLLPEGALKSKIRQAIDNWYNGPLPEALTPQESKLFRQKLSEALKQTPQTSYQYRSLKWIAEDLSYAQRYRKGIYKFERAYSKADVYPQCNTDSNVKELVQRYILPTKMGDAEKLLGGTVSDYSYENKDISAKFVFIIVDAHLRAQQLSISRMVVDQLYPNGFKIVFAESAPFFLNHELQVSPTVFLGGQYYSSGSKSFRVLELWRTPRVSEALEFYYGDQLKTYGSEDPILYSSFAQYIGRDKDFQYITALHQRSEAMVDNVDRQMTTDKAEKSIFIMGGSHTDSVIKRLKERKMNFLVVLPKEGVHPLMLIDQRRYNYWRTK